MIHFLRCETKGCVMFYTRRNAADRMELEMIKQH